MLPYMRADSYSGSETYYPALIEATNNGYSSGIIPTWNEKNFCGYPSIADPPYWGFFYPFHYIYYVFNLSPPLQKNFELLLHFIFLGGVCYFGIKSLGFPEFTAFICSMIIYSSSLYIKLVNGGYDSLFISLPFLFGAYFLLEKWLQTKKITFMFVYSLLLGINILGGFFQLTIYFLAMIFFRVAAEEWSRYKNTKKLKLSFLPIFSLFTGLGILAGSPQLLPMLYYAKFTTRGAQGIIWNAEESLNPMFILKLLFFPGSAATGCAVILIILTAAHKKLFSSRIYAFWFCCAFFALFYSFGFYTPLFYLTVKLPGFNMLRRTNRILVFLPLSLSILSAFAIRDYNHDLKKLKYMFHKNTRLIFIIISLTFIYGFIIQLFFTNIDVIYENIILPIHSIPFLENNILKLQNRFGFNSSEFLSYIGWPYNLIWVVVVSTIFIYSYRKPKFIKIFVMLLFFEIILSAFKIYLKPALFSLKDYNLPPSILSRLDSAAPWSRVFITKEKRTDINPIIDIVMIPYKYKLKSLNGFSIFLSKRYGLYIIEAINGLSLSENYKAPELLYVENPESPLVKFLNVEYILSSSSCNYTNWQLVDRSDSIFLYKNNTGGSPVYFFKKIQFSPSTEESLRLLKNSDPIFINSTLIAEQKFSEKETREESDDTGIAARVIKYRAANGRIEIDLEAFQNCFALFPENYDKLWEAEIDRNKVAIFPAHLTFIGIRIPSGKHTITLKHSYSPLKMLGLF